MNKKLVLIMTLVLIFGTLVSFTACNGISGVTPCAWVSFDNEGYVYYTANVVGDHIIFYENEADAEGDTFHSNYAVCISFSPRILGKDERNGVVCTTVEVTKNNSMTVYIKKDKSTYGADKKVYLNGVALTPTTTNDWDELLCLNFENISLERGNPGGHANDVLNHIEYK